MSLPRLNLIVLRVADLERAAAFYRRVGLEFSRHAHGSGPMHYASETSDVVFALYSSRRWLEHFTLNARRGPKLPWAAGATLDDRERRIVADSIRQFQLGESGEGRHLKACAAAYAKASGDADYPAALDAFVAEE